MLVELGLCKGQGRRGEDGEVTGRRYLGAEEGQAGGWGAGASSGTRQLCQIQAPFPGQHRVAPGYSALLGSAPPQDLSRGSK